MTTQNLRPPTIAEARPAHPHMATATTALLPRTATLISSPTGPRAHARYGPPASGPSPRYRASLGSGVLAVSRRVPAGLQKSERGQFSGGSVVLKVGEQPDVVGGRLGGVGEDQPG